MRSMSEIFKSEGLQMPDAEVCTAPLYRALYAESRLGIPFPTEQKSRLAWLEERLHKSGAALLAEADTFVRKYGLGSGVHGEPPEMAAEPRFETFRSYYARGEITARLEHRDIRKDENTPPPEGFNQWARNYRQVVDRRKAELAARTGEPVRSIPAWVPLYAQPPKKGEPPMTVPEAFAAAGLEWTESDEEPPERPPEVPMPELPEVPMPSEPPPGYDDEVPF